MRPRWLLLAALAPLVGLVGLGAGALALPSFLPELAASQGVTLGGARWCDAGLCLEDVQRRGVRVATAELGWDRTLRLADATVDVQGLGGGGSEGAATSGASAAAGGPDGTGSAREVEALARRWLRGVVVERLQIEGAPVPLPPLSGQVLPERRLEGEGVVVDGDTVRAEIPTEFGVVRVEATPEGAGARVAASCAACSVTVPELSPDPLTLPLVEAEGTVVGRTLTGTVTVEGATVDVTASEADGQIRAVVRAEALPVATLYALVRDAVPEAAKARIDGTLAFEATVRWPDRDLEVTPTLTGLTVRGVLPAGYAQGPFSWPGRDDQGQPLRRTSGEGTPGWMPLAEMGELLPMAVVAAEDGQFWNHRGYDVAGMLAAARDNEARGETWRGGSTLTQQLAKNLFLDGTRTYARKLRELLYAVELEQRLGKQRILEIYLNIAEWGPGMVGAAQAADRYFLKHPARLLPEEAAWLATLLPRPRSAYAAEYLKNQPGYPRLHVVLDHMTALAPEVRDAAKARTLRFVPP